VGKRLPEFLCVFIDFFQTFLIEIKSQTFMN